VSDTIIKVENLSKRFIIGHQSEGVVRYKSLRESINNSVSSLVERFSKPSGKANFNPNQEEFWALKDISFEIKQGERVGIIGRNGAGKSTLLKVLSRITEPTAGRITIRGRVASLLEVGTGFHPELTGRENIFLNGAILGMSKAEINRKFDEIVDFAEVEKFLDTPVKRYSSGMYVRLAFAVAAHLEPEVLIVDEVLAVGDIQFQKKCLGKMDDVGREGRTVLFVSHNMQAISRLTSRCVFLSNGQCVFNGQTSHAVDLYKKLPTTNIETYTHYKAPPNILHNHVAWARVNTSNGEGLHFWGQPITFEFALQIIEPRDSLVFSFQIIDDSQQPVCDLWFVDPQSQNEHYIGPVSNGIVKLSCKIPKLRLYMGSYTITTWLSDRRINEVVEKLSDKCNFEVTMQGIHSVNSEWQWNPKVCVYLEESTWELVK
jgi:ABC-type polysaccharide/polyol phosphate transport system ATPase subunit